jgi:hypothetical protein
VGRNRKTLPPLSEDTIVRWPWAHNKHTWRWPIEDACHVAEIRGVVCLDVTAAQATRFRGLPGGDSLARL